MITRRNATRGLIALGASLLSRGGRSAADEERYGPQWRERVMAQLKPTREHAIKRFTDYMDAGLFPQNVYKDGVRIAVFLDRRGVPCAVADLFIGAGHGLIVAQVRDTNNYLRVMEIKEGELMSMVVWSGLTQEELAQVQPSYEFVQRQIAFQK